MTGGKADERVEVAERFERVDMVGEGGGAALRGIVIVGAPRTDSGGYDVG